MAKLSLREYANSWLKDKGMTVSEAKKDADKYKSISAAKKANSLYYTGKEGKPMLAVYAEDLKKPDSMKTPRPKARPESKTPKVSTTAPAQPKTTGTTKSNTTRSGTDSKAATSGAVRVSPAKPSGQVSSGNAPSISAARVKSKGNIERGRKAVNSPVTTTTNKTEKMGTTPIRKGSYTGTPTKSKAKTPDLKTTKPSKLGPTYAEWRKKNSGGIVAYNKDMKKKGLKPRISAGNK